MPNMNVPYQRPDRALITLRDEAYAAYRYTPRRACEFVTGYKSPENFTGHNADANGIVHAVDIFTDENGNLPEGPGRELAQKIIDEMKRRRLPRGYVIHDMSPGAPWPAIASYATGYQWVDYNGPAAHSDHIHVSMCDLYWGDPAPVGANVYDNTASWNLGTLTTQSSMTTPIQEEDIMASIDDLKHAIREVTKEGYGIVDSVWYRPINGFNGAVSAEARILGTDQAVNDIRALLASQNAQIAGLVSAIASINKGEPFDEAKLLEGIKAAAETGVKDAIDSITTTVTVKGGE